MAKEPTVENGDIDDILSEMGGAKSKTAAAAAAPKPVQADAPRLSNIESLLSDAKTVPDESSTTQDMNGTGADSGAAGRKPSANAAERPSRFSLAGKGLWLICAILTINTMGILGIGAAFFFFSGFQKNNFSMLVQTLRDVGQKRQGAAVTEEADPKKQAAAQAEQAIKIFDTGDFEKALPLLQAASAALPDRADLLWKTGHAAEQLKQWRVALDAFEKFSRDFPRDEAFGQSLVNLAACYKQLGHYAMARRTQYRLIALSGRLPENQQQIVRQAYLEIADSYSKEAGTEEPAPVAEKTAAPAKGAHNDGPQ